MAVHEHHPDLFTVEDASSEPSTIEIRSPAGDASVRARWRALVLTDPVARLVRNAGHAGIDDDVFDLRQLALAAIDVAVASMGFARQITLAQLVDTVAGLARLMDGREDSAAAVETARWVVRGLLNDAENQGKFVYVFHDIRSTPHRREEYAFRLLSLQDSPSGAVVQASPQAVMLYLNGLNLDVDDAEEALSVVLRRQLDDRRFEAAGRTAETAERASVAMAATLADIIESTRRDVRSADWLVDVPARLARARKHVKARIEADGQVIGHVMSGIDAESDAAVRRASGDLVETLQRIRDVHLDLASRAAGAREVLQQAQLRQVFSRPVRLRLLNVERELFEPILTMTTADAQAVGEAFTDRILGFRLPRVLHLGDLVDTLLASTRQVTPVGYAPEDPGNADEADAQAYPPKVIAAATKILRQAEHGPVPLTQLVDAATAVDPDEVDGAVEDLIELVTLAALWAYAPDLPEPGDSPSAGIDTLIAALEAERTAHTIDRPMVWGNQLMISAIEAAS
ncbi:hypothetical protein GCM10010201_33890 [Pilimelia columellifera subsp. columellifera]|uniref:Uncharacterized protein n=1 Tax=Pilimelia columellifera subsp. columellifera TaxID=706583 RepID=A0ABP6B129_9ACTN